MTLPEVHLIGGSCAEAVKLAPVVLAMREAGLLTPVLVAGSHDPATVNALAAFDLAPDVTLTAGGQSEVIKQLAALWTERPPAAVIVQGDTTASLAGALAAGWRQIPVVHLEAGLRSGDLNSPFPAEANRRLVAQLATLHLAPTPLAAMNLLDENVAPGDVLITGSTAVDAALAVAGRELAFENAAIEQARTGKRLVLVTVRRPEFQGEPLARIIEAVTRLSAKYPDIEVLVDKSISYPDLSRLLAEAYLVLTDSDDIEEVAPSFGVPVLVLREVTQRVEALRAGCAKLLGSDTGLIVREASALLDSRLRRDAMGAVGNPYGDGLAAARTAQATAALLGLAERPEPMPMPKPLPLPLPRTQARTVNQSAPVTFERPSWVSKK
jgi:UDP-N-acetylglucosamine 2-epimerase (non-hydrolysing)